MKNVRMLLLVTSGLTALVQGCTAQKGKTTGFLSDYSRLKPESNVTARYAAPQAQVVKYSSFIVDPVEIHLQSGSRAKLTPAEQTELTQYMYKAIVAGLRGSNYGVAEKPGPGVARVRVALTDFKKSKIAQNLLPKTKFIGTGLGGASIEGEVLDSQTQVQVGAFVDSQLGNRFSLDGLSTWGDAKAVMDQWVTRAVERLDKIHGR